MIKLQSHLPYYIYKLLEFEHPNGCADLNFYLCFGEITTINVLHSDVLCKYVALYTSENKLAVIPLIHTYCTEYMFPCLLGFAYLLFRRTWEYWCSNGINSYNRVVFSPSSNCCLDKILTAYMNTIWTALYSLRAMQ